MDKAESVTDKAAVHLSTFLKKQGDNAEAHALMAGVMGFQISFSPMKGMWLGRKSNNHLDKAMNLGSDKPLVWHQSASSFYHKPATFGGDLDKAIEQFQESVKLYEQNKTDLSNNWAYLNTKTWLGIAYQKKGMKEQAVCTYDDILAQVPDFGWVKKVLKPKAEQ